MIANLRFVSLVLATSWLAIGVALAAIVTVANILKGWIA